MKPGLHNPEYGDHTVVWWDPAALKLNVEARLGLHHEDILSPDDQGRAEESVRLYEEWKNVRASRLETGSTASLAVFTPTGSIPSPAGRGWRLKAPGEDSERVEIIHLPRTTLRPAGPRFGSLVHLVLRDASLTATRESLLQLAQTHGRLLAASADEIPAAAAAVFDALQHPFLSRVRQSSRVHRELPVTLRTEANEIFEGVIDLAFFESGKWIITDFKTDADQPDRQSRYRLQVGWYMHAMEQTTGAPAEGCLFHI